jgi:superkiller protein 3
MKQLSYYVGLILLLGVSLSLIGCQVKEVTSAKVYIQQNEWDKATEQLEMAAELYPDNAEAHFLLGKAYGKKAWFQKMMEAFNASLAISSQFEKSIDQERTYYWQTEFNAGVTAFNNDEIDSAARHFNVCILIDPDQADAYKNLGTCYQRANILDKAIEVYRLLLDRTPEDAEAMLRLHAWLKATNQLDEAIAVLLEAQKVAPENVDVLTALAISYDMQENTEKAFELYRLVIEKNPENSDVLFNLGRLYLLNNEYENAIGYFNKVIAIDPDDYESNLNIGNAYLSIGEKLSADLKSKEEEQGQEFSEEHAHIKALYLKAIPYFQKALEIKPEQASAWNNLGVAYIRSDQIEKGEEAFKKAEALNSASQ